MDFHATPNTNRRLGETAVAIITLNHYISSLTYYR